MGSLALSFRLPASQPVNRCLGLRLSHPFLSPAVQLGLGARAFWFLGISL